MEGGGGEGLQKPQKLLDRRSLLKKAGAVGASIAAGGFGGYFAAKKSEHKTPSAAQAPLPTPSATSTETATASPTETALVLPSQTPTIEQTSTVQATATKTKTPENPTTTPEPSKTPTSTETRTVNAQPSPTKEATMATSEEPAMQPTDEPDEVAEEDTSPTPSPTATETHKKKRTLKEKLRDANPDYELMQKLYDSNTQIIENPWGALSDPKLSGEWLPDGFGNGWCLMGVRLSMKLAGIHLEDLKGIGSAFKAKAVFENHPELFEKINISRESLHRLPAGTILVYQPNQGTDPDGGTYDEVEGVHHGHIEIIRGKDAQGNVLAGSDHLANLKTNLSLMHHDVSAWVLKRQ